MVLGGGAQRGSGSSVRRLTAALAVAVVTGVGLATAFRWFAMGSTGAGDPAAPKGLGRAVIGLVILALVAGAWWLVGDRPLAALGLAVVGLSWLSAGLSSVVTFSPWVRAALLASTPLALAGIAGLVASWTPRSGWRQPTARVAIGLALGSALVHLFGYSPFDDVACERTCEPSPAPLALLLGPRTALGLSVLLAVAAAAAGLTTIRGRSGTPGPLRWAAAAATVFMTTATVLPWWSWGSSGHVVAADRLAALAVAVLTAGVLWVEARVRVVRRNVALLLDQLGRGSAVGNGPGRERVVHFTGPGIQGWVGRDGATVPALEGEHLILLEGTAPALRIEAGPGERAGQVQAELTPAARMALENARLDALARARLAEIQLSQRRIVAATDAERSRIARDLHDGAQQRLVAVALHLRAAGSRTDPATAAVLAEAALQVHDAVEALRVLAHGTVPPVLFEEGLGVAVRELAATGPLRVDVVLHGPLDGVPEPVAVTAFLAVSAGLDNVVRHARADKAALTIASNEDRLTVHIVDDGVGGAALGTGLSDIADRVGALGGTMSVEAGSGGGTMLTVELPCGS